MNTHYFFQLNLNERCAVGLNNGHEKAVMVLLILLLTFGGRPRERQYLHRRGDGLGDQQVFMIDAHHIYLTCH